MNVHDRLKKHGLIAGHMLSYSKSTYYRNNPNHEAYFNANIFTRDGKVWWGDIDLTISGELLQKVADEAGEALYVLREHDGRWENETRPFKEVKKLAVKVYEPRKRDMFDVVKTIKKIIGK